jgi:hypothetical protein
VEALNKVKFAATKSLTRLVMEALESATLKIEAQAMQFAGSQPPPIREESPKIAERFLLNLNEYFDELTSLNNSPKAVAELEADNLTLVDHDYLEAVIAMEGMVTHARNSDVKQYISFTARLDSLFSNMQIDESNNPLDPEQIGDSFNEAVRPLGLKAHYLLTIAREFNKSVFHNLESIFEEANEILIDLSVLPSLDMKARNKAIQKKRMEDENVANEAISRTSPKDRTEDLFDVMQTLVKGLAVNTINSGTAGSAPKTGTEEINQNTSGDELEQIGQLGRIEGEQKTQALQQSQLMDMLTNIQSSLADSDSTSAEAVLSAVNNTLTKESINKSLEQGVETGEIESIDAKSNDVINFVTLLFEAIWKDDSLPVAMKELIGRTQITIMKIALSDSTFFKQEQHPARVILNEFAMAGISWTETDDFKNDPMFKKVEELISRILSEPDVDNSFLEGLIKDLRSTKAQQSGKDLKLEERIRETKDHSKQLDDVHEFVKAKLDERVFKVTLDPSISKLLDTYLHDFLVKLVLKEGPESNTWKPVLNTIDVLLWTVQADKQPGDKERFDKVNPRLLENLTKVLGIAGASKTKITKIMRQLKQVQEYSFHKAEIATQQSGAGSDKTAATTNLLARKGPDNAQPNLAKNDSHLMQVAELPVGAWVEFDCADEKSVRCALATKISSIDKLFFINNQGVRLVEISRMNLAHELKAGSARIIGDSALLDRAMEAVISELSVTTPNQEAESASADAWGGEAV